MDLASIQKLPPAEIQALLPVFLGSYIRDPTAQATTVARLSEMLLSWSESEISEIITALIEVGEEPRLYPAHPLGQLISRVWSGELLQHIELNGVEHLGAAAAAGPTAMVCNHLSYFDSTAIDAILANSEASALCNRLVSAAGPKVYDVVFRRFASMCLSTLPVPQSTSLGHTARLSPRELARMALASVKTAHNAMHDGWILLIFPEGSRTRTGRLRPFLKGVYRYLNVEGLQVVPAGLVGTNQIMRLEDERCVPAPVSLSFGTPIHVDSAGGGRDALQQAYHSIATLLPDSSQPESDQDVVV